jgi:hypothetical protein
MQPNGERDTIAKPLRGHRLFCPRALSRSEPNSIQMNFTSDSLVVMGNSVHLPDSQESEYDRNPFAMRTSHETDSFNSVNFQCMVYIATKSCSIAIRDPLGYCFSF